jgi:hypothetical protein
MFSPPPTRCHTLKPGTVPEIERSLPLHDKRRLCRWLYHTVAITVLGCGSRSTPPGMIWNVDESLGVRFAYPDSFLVGRFVDVSLPTVAAMEPPFHRAVVLVRPADLGGRSLDSIPVGEVPVIWFDQSVATTTAFRILQPDTTYMVGTLRVTRFPGFPGPYGNEAFYYVVKFPDGTLLEVGAHRHSMIDRGVETHFDEVIEQMLPTLGRVEG